MSKTAAAAKTVDSAIIDGMTKVEVPSLNKQGCCWAVITDDTKQSKRGLVVLQEWWGLNKQIQEEAKDIAKRGNFVVIVPDLYRGKVTTDNEEAGHFMSNLDWAGAIADIRGCVQYLKSHGCTKVGVTGFCMGGALSMASAANIPEVDAAAPFYGIPSPDLADPATIKIPLQCHFGAQDTIAGFSDPEAQKKLREKLEKASVKHEFHVYDANHAFTNHSSPNFCKEACELSFKRMIEFFQANL